MKKLALYSLVSFVSLAASSSTVYLAMYIQNAVTNNANDVQSSEEEVIPVVEETNFAKTLNKAMKAKDIKIKDCKVSIESDQISSFVDLSLANLEIDISSLPQVKVKGDINVCYGDIDESLSLAFNSQDKMAYFTYSSKSFKIKSDSFIDSVFKVCKALNINLPDISSKLKDFDFQEIASMFSSMSLDPVESNTLEGIGYTLNLPDLKIGESTISGLSIFLESDKEHNLKFVKILDNGSNKGKISIDNKISLSLSSSLEMKEESTYKDVDSDSYIDISSSTSSILTSLTDLFGSKKIDAKIKLDLIDEGEDRDLSSTVLGSIKADVSKVGLADLTKGEYEVSLNHLKQQELLNRIDAHYKNSTTYVKFNELFKGKIRNSTVEDLFSNLSNITGDIKVKSIENMLNTVVSNVDVNAIKEGNIDIIKQYIKELSFDERNFKLVVDANFFGFGDYDITLNIKTDENRIIALEILNLKYHDFTINFSVNPEFPGQIDFSPVHDDYKDYKSIVPIFKTIADYIEKKQVSADYSIVYLSSKKTFSATGKIEADIKDIGEISKGTLTDGKYHLSFDTKAKECDHKLDLIYQDNSIYFNYNDVMRQSIKDTQLNEISEVIGKYSSSEDKTIIEKINDYVNELLASPQYDYCMTMLKKGSLSFLDKFIKIDASNTDPDLLVVDIDASYILQNTSLENKVSSIKIALSNDDKQIRRLSVTTAESNDESMSFTLDFKDYDSSFVLDELKKKLYIPVDNLSSIIESFYHLPIINEKRFSMLINGEVVDDQNRSLAKISDDSGVAIDVTDKNRPQAYGKMNITHPSLDSLLSQGSLNFSSYANQKLRFKYQTLGEDSSLDGQFVAEYNDKMHILLNKSSVLEVYDNIRRGDSPTNLLHRYLKVLTDTTTSSSSVLIDAIKSKDMTKLLDYPYIKKAEVLSDRIDISVDGKLISSSDEGKEEKISVIFDLEKKCIKEVSIKGSINGMVINASISLADFANVVDPTADENSPMLQYNDENKGKFVDLNGLGILSKCLIDTTENNFMRLTGAFTLKGKIIGINAADLKTFFDARISVFDEHAYVHLSFNNNPTIDSQGNVTAVKTINDKGFYASELFISEKQIEICQTKNKSGTITSEVMKIDDNELLNNIVYYLMTYILNADNELPLGSTIMAQIYKAMYDQSASSDSSSVKLTNDFSTVISPNTRYVQDDNPHFHLELDLNKVFDDTLSSAMSLSFSNTTVDLYHDVISNDIRNPFTKLNLSTQLSFASMINITAGLNVDLGLDNIDAEKAKTKHMVRYLQFTDAFKENYGGFKAFTVEDNTFSSDLPLYVINKINISKNWLGVASYKVNDNSSVAKKTFNYSSADEKTKVFFYQ